MNNFRRRDTLKLGLGASASMAFPLIFAQGGGPIRIGMNIPLSGPISNLGRDIQIGAEVAVSQINREGGVLGRKIELVARDDKANPTQTVANMRELTGSGINLIVGSVPTNSVLAAIPALEEANAVQVSTGSVAMSVTHEKFSRHVFRGILNDYMQMRAYALLAAELYPNVTRWTCMNLDLEATAQSWELFKKAMTLSYKAIKKDVTFADPILTKFGASDFKNNVAAAMRSDAEGILQLVYGQGAVTLFQQGKALGLQEKFKVTLDRGNDPSFAKALGSMLPQNYWMATSWYPALYRQLPKSVALEKEATARLNGGPPGGFVLHGHNAVTALVHGVRTAKSTDTAAVINAMETTPFESAIGRTQFRKDDHQPLVDANFVQVEGSEGPEKFKVVKSKRYPTADLIEPPSPGQPFKF